MTLTNSVLGDNNPYVFLFNTNLFFNISRWSGSQWNLNGGGLPQASSIISSVWTNTLVPNGVAYNFLRVRLNNQFLHGRERKVAG
jgi:hypothetical protein